jgi:hypothetical protein
MSIVRVELPISGAARHVDPTHAVLLQGVARHVDPIHAEILQGHMSQDAWKILTEDLDKILEVLRQAESREGCYILISMLVVVLWLVLYFMVVASGGIALGISVPLVGCLSMLSLAKFKPSK